MAVDGCCLNRSRARKKTRRRRAYCYMCSDPMIGQKGPELDPVFRSRSPTLKLQRNLHIVGASRYTQPSTQPLIPGARFPFQLRLILAVYWSTVAPSGFWLNAKRPYCFSPKWLQNDRMSSRVALVTCSTQYETLLKPQDHVHGFFRDGRCH